MTLYPAGKEKIKPQLISFAILFVSFFIASPVLLFDLSPKPVIQALLFAAIIMLSIQLARFLLPNPFDVTNAIVQTMINNALGLLIGLIITFLFINFLFLTREIITIVASLNSLFILGTLSACILNKQHPALKT
tara:strand:- start:685 stop:1086 length:402 start_codon:yes stop_codon:yes gene_type:complete